MKSQWRFREGSTDLFHQRLVVEESEEDGEIEGELEEGGSEFYVM